MMRKAFLYRLYPSRTQARLLDATLETCRFFYNDCLAERKTAFHQRGETISKFEQLRQLKLSGIGRLALRWHRPIEGAIKTLRISKKAGKWYAAFSCVVDDSVPAI